MTADTDWSTRSSSLVSGFSANVHFAQQDASKGVERFLGNMFSLTPKNIISL